LPFERETEEEGGGGIPSEDEDFEPSEVFLNFEVRVLLAMEDGIFLLGAIKKNTKTILMEKSLRLKMKTQGS